MTTVSQPSQSSLEQPGGTVSGQKIGRWQFSLRGLMLFVLLVAMGMALFTTGWRLLRAEKELEEYRREYGILKVDNPAMLHAVARWTPEPGRWRWKVHFPPGRYDVCYATKGLHGVGFPEPSGGLTTDFSGEVSLSAAFFKELKSGKWVCCIDAGAVSTSPYVPENVVNPRTWSTGGVKWNQEPAVVSPDTPVVLLRRQIGAKQKNGSFIVPNPSEGLMIWIRRVGKPTQSCTICW
jgi:hypothetical protein